MLLGKLSKCNTRDPERLLVYLQEQIERDHRRAAVGFVAEQLADHDHRLGEVAAKKAYRDRQELFHLTATTKLADRRDHLKVPTIQAEAIPATRDRLQGQSFVIICKERRGCGSLPWTIYISFVIEFRTKFYL